MESENSNLRFALGLTTGLVAVFGLALFFGTRPLRTRAKASRPIPYMKQGNLLQLLSRDNG